jgi:hypothetical protein
MITKKIGFYRPTLNRLSWLDHWRCGRHSGFPICCVVWWLTGWRLVRTNENYIAWMTNRHRPWYIQCPFCIMRGHTVPMRDCAMRCRPYNILELHQEV